jgi:hypothetical protein
MLENVNSCHVRSYQPKCTRSRSISEVKLVRAKPVVRWVTTCEALVLNVSFELLRYYFDCCIHSFIICYHLQCESLLLFIQPFFSPLFIHLVNIAQSNPRRGEYGSQQKLAHTTQRHVDRARVSAPNPGIRESRTCPTALTQTRTRIRSSVSHCLTVSLSQVWAVGSHSLGELLTAHS